MQQLVHELEKSLSLPPGTNCGWLCHV